MPKIINTEPDVQEIDLRTLEHAHYNPREIADDAAAGLNESLADYGLLELPVVNLRHDPPRLIGGHQRVTQLLARGYTHAPCVVVRFDDAAEMAANVALNSEALQGNFDAVRAVDNLDVLRAKVKTPSRAGLERLEEKLREQAKRVRAQTNPKATEENEVEPQPTAKPVSKPGIAYQLGDHLLYCGPFQEGVPAMLGARKRVDLVLTDPPYNIGYTSGKWFRNDALREALEGDDENEGVWEEFIGEVVKTALRRTNNVAVVFSAAKWLHTVEVAVDRAKGTVQRWVAMVKDAHPLSPGDYHPQYELLALLSRGAEVHYFGDHRTNVIATKRPTKNEYHPTQKPLDPIRQLIGDFTDVGATVLDLCAGGGSTLVVAQEMERTAFACEIDPQHCDRIRARWAAQVHGDGAAWEELTPPA